MKYEHKVVLLSLPPNDLEHYDEHFTAVKVVEKCLEEMGIAGYCFVGRLDGGYGVFAKALPDPLPTPPGRPAVFG